MDGAQKRGEKGGQDGPAEAQREEEECDDDGDVEGQRVCVKAASIPAEERVVDRPG